MEDDRAEVDLGIAVDIEQTQIAAANAAAPGLKQPKKRFVGRRTAAQAAQSGSWGGDAPAVTSGAVQGKEEIYSLGLTLRWHDRELSVD